MNKIILLLLLTAVLGDNEYLVPEETQNVHMYLESKVVIKYRQDLGFYPGSSIQNDTECSSRCVTHPSKQMGEFSRNMNNYMKYLKTFNSSQLYVTDMETNSLNHRELKFSYKNKPYYCRTANQSCSLLSPLVFLQCLSLLLL